MEKLVQERTKNRQCIVTGIDISMQKAESRFLNTVGIRHIFNTDPEKYRDLVMELPSKYHNVETKKQIYKIAHRIRDQYFNLRNPIRRKMKEINSRPALFNNNELISKHKLALANLP